MSTEIRHGTYYGFLQHKLRRALGLPGGQPCAACLRKAAATVTFLHDSAPDRGGEK